MTGARPGDQTNQPDPATGPTEPATDPGAFATAADDAAAAATAPRPSDETPAASHTGRNAAVARVGAA